MAGVAPGASSRGPTGAAAWVRTHRLWAVVLALLAVSAVFAAVTNRPEGGAGGVDSASSPSASTSSHPASGPSPASTGDGLTAFGATQEAWDAHHTPDTRFEAGAAYDPTPGLGDGERFDARYYAVMATGGRVLSYSERLPPGTDQRLASTIVGTDDLPADARLVWGKRDETCLQMQFTSAALSAALGPGVGVLVSYYGSSLDAPYDASRVAKVLLADTYSPTSADASC